VATIQQRHEDLVALRRNHPAWRLLAADHAPLVVAFCERIFLEPNVRRLPGPELVDALDDHLHALRGLDPDAYPKSAAAYIADWAEPRTGSVRKHYPAGSDIPHYEPTAAVETAAAFVRGLGPREFLGTASRLLIVRDLLRQITAGAAPDPAVRLAALQRQRAEIDAEIDAIRSGVDTGLDDTAIRERYAQATSTARELLADLREVEENFRALDRDVRRRATTWDGPRGAFLEAVFGSTAEIGASDQGRSWTAFWEHMLSARQRNELDELLAAVAGIPALAEVAHQVADLLRVDLFTAAEATHRTVASLSAQLRRFLDEQSWSEGRRIHEIIRTTLSAALAVRDGEVRDLGSELPATRADIALPLERPLYAPKTAATLDTCVTAPAAAPDGDALLDLLELNHIDLAALRAAVADTVARRGGNATLGQVIADHPLTDGLAELVGYLQLPDAGALFLGDRREQVRWADAGGTVREADLPVVLFGHCGAPPAPAPLRLLAAVTHADVEGPVVS
jgi:hypothetical protein